MNIAVILAGGSGKRTEQEVPKQFINVFDKPIIAYTLEAFQRHPGIDGIIVVCLEGWGEILKAYARQYDITKLKWVIKGGANGQESTQKAIFKLREICGAGDVVIVHDAVRPFVSGDIISDCIATCLQYGNGLSAVRFQAETIVRSGDGISGSEIIDRNNIMRVMTPQAYLYEKALWALEQAQERGITAVYINVLMAQLGEKLYFAKGSAKNVKLTTAEDIEIFKALYLAEKEDWIK